MLNVTVQKAIQTQESGSMVPAVSRSGALLRKVSGLTL